MRTSTRFRRTLLPTCQNQIFMKDQIMKNVRIYTYELKVKGLYMFPGQVLHKILF